jgi:hypothetical protein
MILGRLFLLTLLEYGIRPSDVKPFLSLRPRKIGEGEGSCLDGVRRIHRPVQP